MKVTIEYFAAARDLAGVRTESVDVASGATVRDLEAHIASSHARLAPLLTRMSYAVNGEQVFREQALRDGDEIFVMPPVAGGADALVAIRQSALSVDEVLAAVRDPAHGGIAMFIGTVRDHSHGKHVERLEYEAQIAMAERMMREIVDALLATVPGARLAAVHRVGSLAVGELAVIVAASAPHRAEAFALCRDAIERLKASVPIWKREVGTDGSASWVNLDGGCCGEP